MAENSNQSNGTILLIEDNEHYINGIEMALTKDNYRVVVATTAKDAFNFIFKTPADLVILDINLQDLDGFHVAKELKRNMMLRHIPVIILSGRVDFLEKMKTMDMMVDEYLVKPLDYAELVLRIRLVLQRVRSSLDANPLTHLPGNIAIVRSLKEKIQSGKPYAVGYVDLNNFKAFNDKYGFSRGDQLINMAAKTIVEAVQRQSPDDNFVGHVGGDDFIFICSYDTANDICQKITEVFDAEVPKFYSDEDRKNGYIIVEDRRGIVSQFPIVSMAVGLASDEGGKFTNLGQINHSLTQLKKYAKSFQGSAYVRDRRTLSAKLAEFTWGPGSSGGDSKVLESITEALNSYLPGKLMEIIQKKAIGILFQPILDMRLDEVVGHESLVRGPTGTPLEFPDALFQTARTANLVPHLDILCMQKVLEACTEFRSGIKIFMNVFPETLLDAEMLRREILGQLRNYRVDFVFELSGSHRASDASDLFISLRQLKEAGMKICIDGSIGLSGYALKYLPELRPDYIKINMMTYKDMAQDRQKQDEFQQAVGLIRQVGSEIICTKLESRADSFIALKIGVFLGQGFLFARPAFPTLTSSIKSG